MHSTISHIFSVLSMVPFCFHAVIFCFLMFAMQPLAFLMFQKLANMSLLAERKVLVLKLCVLVVFLSCDRHESLCIGALMLLDIYCHSYSMCQVIHANCGIFCQEINIIQIITSQRKCVEVKALSRHLETNALYKEKIQ